MKTQIFDKLFHNEFFTVIFEKFFNRKREEVENAKN